MADDRLLNRMFLLGFAANFLHITLNPWKIVGLKLALSATTAIGAASILTMAGFDGYMALLFMGLLFVTVGLTLIQVSRVTTDTDPSANKHRLLDSGQVLS